MAANMERGQCPCQNSKLWVTLAAAMNIQIQSDVVKRDSMEGAGECSHIGGSCARAASSISVSGAIIPMRASAPKVPLHSSVSFRTLQAIRHYKCSDSLNKLRPQPHLGVAVS